MLLSKNNLIVKIDSSKKDEYAILNPISGSFDILSNDDYSTILKVKEGKPVDSDFSSILIERGYAYNSVEDENKANNLAYDTFKREVDDTQVQLMLVPTYGCNLACTYCYQHGIDGKPTLISKEIVDSFFSYADTKFGNNKKKPFITLFGGEPLVNSASQRNIIEYIIEKCAEKNYQISVVTNGYDLKEYIDLLKKVEIKEIQVTLDGSQSVHDSRRATSNNKGTFEKIIEGIQAAIDSKMPINLRTVVDAENFKDIINLADYLDKKGWLDLPKELFKTQIGRNYELFECYAKPQHLMSQIELWKEYSEMSKANPVLTKFHRPDFKGIRHIVDTGDMYMASFDTCPACKTEWVFDLYGNIYGCTASCGRDEYLLGTFYPNIDLKEDVINTWKKRDVKNIEKCTSCQYDVICGGGCGVVAANKNNGSILSPDCRPVKELIELGINHYIDDISELCEDDNTSDKNLTGCIICGKELIYKEKSSNATCVLCGKTQASNTLCIDGHFVCDTCHNGSILKQIEQLLKNSNEKSPIKLAEKVFALADLNMHGPEYHSIVPAVLVTAWQNEKNQRNESLIAEAIKRGSDIKGGSCGFCGNCGSGVGSGIAASIISGATPMSGEKRSISSLATGSALIEISKNIGARCCKREAITSIESFAKVTDFFEQKVMTTYTCKQFSDNQDCIHNKCPYFPNK